MYCPECGANNKEVVGFFEGCGKDLKSSTTAYSARENILPISDNGVISSIEKKVYFKIARGFAWLILFIASLSLIGSIVYLIVLLPSVIGGTTKVSKDEINIAITEEERGRAYNISILDKSPIAKNQIEPLSMAHEKFRSDVVRYPTTIIPLEPIVINLAEANRYIKITMQLELVDSQYESTVRDYIKKLRDAASLSVSKKSSNFLTTAEGKIQLKSEMMQRFNQILGGNIIRNVYFSDFVSQ